MLNQSNVKKISDFVSGASKVSLSSLSSQELWEKTGRLKSGSEVNAIDTLHDRDLMSNSLGFQIQ